MFTRESDLTLSHQGVPEEYRSLIGKPWNYNRQMRGVLIPPGIVRNRKIPPAAKLLWGIVRQRTHDDGTCTKPDSFFARHMQVSVRHVRRLLRYLEREKYLLTIPRPGQPPLRVLLVHETTIGAIPGLGPIGLPPLTEVSAPIDRSVNPSKASVEASVMAVPSSPEHSVIERDRSNGDLTPASDILRQIQGAWTDRTKPPVEGKKQPERQDWDTQQELAVTAAIRLCGLEPTAELMGNLHRKQAVYHVSGFQTAAAIIRAHKRISGKRTAQPRGVGWISTVVETEFAEHFPLSRRGV